MPGQALFQVGSQASEGIRLIAENGDPTTAVNEFTGQAEVNDFLATSAPIHRVGGPGSNSLTVEVEAKANANRLSLAVMLICTNDGFTGIDGIRLPGGFKPAIYELASYDAGTEANDELFTSIVDACNAIGPQPVPPPDGMNNRTSTSDPISLHQGIQGIGDLVPAMHD